MKNNYNIVLVHLGDDFFDYILDNINQLLCFENENINLVISKKHLNNLSSVKDKINIIFLEELNKNSNYINFLKNTRLDSSFRGGFWKFATERFYVIECVINQYNMENVYHFENDVMVYFNMNEYNNILSEKYDIGLILDNDSRCIPSFIFIKDSFSISKMNEYIMNNTNNFNDMQMLAAFFQNNTEISCLTLPVIPSSYIENNELINSVGWRVKNNEIYSNDFNLFNSVFDGAAMGQYLGGVDKRNDSRNTVGFINESSVYCVNKFDYVWELDEKNRKILYIIYNNEKIKVNNLHIHSKELNKFKS